MGTENLNQALAQLESSLIKIDSARLQVEKVTESGSELTNATHKLAEEVRAIAGIIKTETVAVIDEFSERLTDFDKKIETSVGKGQENITEQVEKLKKTTKDIEALTVKAINEATSLSVDTITKQEKNTAIVLKTLGTEFTDKLSGFEKQISNTTEKTLGNISAEVEIFKKAAVEIETVSTNSITEVKKLSVETLQKQDVSISKTIASLVDYSTEVHQLIDLITALDLPLRLKNLDIAVEALHTEIENVQNDIKSVEQNISNKIQTSFEQTNDGLLKQRKATKNLTTIIIVSALILLGLLIGLVEYR